MRTEHAKTKVDIAIIGGGIGGLALAIGLQQYGHIRVKLYEAATEFPEIGGMSQIILQWRCNGVRWHCKKRLTVFSWSVLRSQCYPSNESHSP